MVLGDMGWVDLDFGMRQYFAQLPMPYPIFLSIIYQTVE